MAPLLSAMFWGLLPFATAGKLKDPWGKFCGAEDCYALLGVVRGAEKADIRRSYRALSLQHHPDKQQGQKTEVPFSKIAKAYEVLVDDEKRAKYDHCLDHPDAYWEEYGHHWVLEYAPESDLKLVLLGILLFISVFQPCIQHGRHQQAIAALARAADEGLGTRNGGNATTAALRARAEEVLAAREKERDAAEAATATATRNSDGKGSNGSGNGAVSRAGESAAAASKQPKKTKTERKEELRKALSAVILELAADVEIKGSHRKPRLQDVPAVWLAMLPLRLAERAWRYGRWRLYRLRAGRPHGAPAVPPPADRAFWARAGLGGDVWEGLTAEEREAATAEEGGAWEGGEALERWKAEHLGAATLPPRGGARGGLRQRKRGRRGGPGGDGGNEEE